MELLRSRGESESKKRKLEDVLDLLPTPSPEFNSRDSSESESKNRKLEELVPTPSPKFNSSNSSESESKIRNLEELLPTPSPEFNRRDSSDVWELLPTPSPELNRCNSSDVWDLLPTPSPDSSESVWEPLKEEDIIRKEDERKLKYELLLAEELNSYGSEDEEEEDPYFTETEFRKEGELNILQSASRKHCKRHKYFQRIIKKEKSEEGKGVREIFGASVIAGWFCDFPSPSASAFLSKFANLDAETLKSHLQDGINSEELGIPDWEELAKYVKQLQESDEGFDLDEYKNLGRYTEGLPRRLPDKRLAEYVGIDACMKAAMDFYKMSGGGELKEGEVVKANAMWSSQFGEYYITFSARSCLDGKKRDYQARVMYNEVKRAVHWGQMMVRIKKGN